MIRSGMTKRLRRWRGNLNVNLVSRWRDKILISSLKETFKSNVWSDLNAMKKCTTFIKQAKTIRIQYEEEQGLGTLNMLPFDDSKGCKQWRDLTTFAKDILKFLERYNLFQAEFIWSSKSCPKVSVSFQFWHSFVNWPYLKL